MVSSINTNAINSLLRSQTSATPGLKATSAAAQAIIEQLRNPTQTTASNTATAAAQTTTPSRNLPRGSLVNVLV